MIEATFNKENFKAYCNLVASKDPKIQQIIDHYDYPPFWSRTANFEGLVRIILEQQVSLASAYACFHKLKKAVSEITPENLLHLQERVLKSCGISRQKITYLKTLAQEIQLGQLNLDQLNTATSAIIRKKLITIKGIGNWTIDVYLLSALHRLDVFPVGDLVLIKALKGVKIVREDDSKEQMVKKCEKFRPYRSILCNLLWHQYIIEKQIDPKLMD